MKKVTQAQENEEEYIIVDTIGGSGKKKHHHSVIFIQILLPFLKLLLCNYLLVSFYSISFQVIQLFRWIDRCETMADMQFDGHYYSNKNRK